MHVDEENPPRNAHNELLSSTRVREASRYCHLTFIPILSLACYELNFNFFVQLV